VRIGIISDTHDYHQNVHRAIEIFNEHAVDYVLHAGDITGAHTIEMFSNLTTGKLIAVFGNCDTDRAAVRVAVERIGGQIASMRYQGTLDGRAIHMTHTPDAVPEAVRSGKFDLVVYGHTHRQDIRTVGKTLIVNPGPARNWMTDPSEIAILDTADMTTTTQPIVPE
jgi:putative phosphoesterase